MKKGRLFWKTDLRRPVGVKNISVQWALNSTKVVPFTIMANKQMRNYKWLY